MNTRFIALAVALPALTLALSIADAEDNLAGGESYRLPVEGYDPRDLLRGRYLRYRVKLDAAPPLDDCTGSACCLCLSQDGPPRVASCELARTQCDAAMPQRHLKDLRRYYIPEGQARQLERRFIDAARDDEADIVVTVGADGKPYVEHLELRGERIE